MAGDIDAAGKPDLVMPLGVFDEALQRGQTSGATQQAAMHADGQHFRRTFAAFRIEHVEGVLQVLVEVVTLVEALHLGEAHVVGVQRIGDHQVRLDRRGFRVPVGQVVIVGVRVVEEAAVLAHQTPSVGAGAAGVPAQRALAGEFRENTDGLEHVFTLLGLIHVLVVDPAITVAADFVAVGDHGLDDLRMMLRGQRPRRRSSAECRGA